MKKRKIPYLFLVVVFLFLIYSYHGRNEVKANTPDQPAGSSALTESSSQYSGHATEGVNIRDVKSGAIVGRFNTFDEVSGVLRGNWLYFSRRNQQVKVYRSYISDDPNIEAYILKGSNIRRSPNGSIVESAKNPRYIRGQLAGGWIKFYDQGQERYVHKSVVSKYGYGYSGYLSGTVNIRQTPNGKLLGSERTGYYIEGRLEKNWVRISYKGQIGYVYEPLIDQQRTRVARYILPGTNIRQSPDGKIVFNSKRVFYVKGYQQGDWFQFTYQGSTRYVHYSLLRTNAPNRQSSLIVLPGTNIRSAADQSIVRKSRGYEKVVGKVVQDRIIFTENGKTLSAHTSLTIDDPSSSFRKFIHGSEDLGSMSDGLYWTKNGFILEIKNGIARIEGTIIANKSFSLPSTYNPGLTSETSAAFYNMQAAIGQENMSLWIASGFRSYYTQLYLFNSYANTYGTWLADTFSARAGYSEHQLGQALDINSIDDRFNLTSEGRWLNRNAWYYGFVLRYPESKQQITGYKFEPWHYRYVGYTLARKLYNGGDWLTFEEYFGIPSQYK